MDLSRISEPRSPGGGLEKTSFELPLCQPSKLPAWRRIADANGIGDVLHGR